MIDRMSHDLKEEFPEMNGFSARNLKYMRKFAESWLDSNIVQRTVAQIPWRSNRTASGQREKSYAGKICSVRIHQPHWGCRMGKTGHRFTAG